MSGYLPITVLAAALLASGSPPLRAQPGPEKAPVSFSDVCEGGAITEIRVRSGWWLDGVQVVCPGRAHPHRGGTGGAPSVFRLEAGEQIRAISGSTHGAYGDYVYSLQFHTDRRASPVYGDGGPEKGLRPFRFEVASDAVLLGLSGRAGEFLHAVAAVVGNPPRADARSSTDRPDDVAGVQVHLVYAVPSNGPDERLDLDGRIADQVVVAQRWLMSQVGRRIRFDTYRGAPDITFLRLPHTHQEIRRLRADLVLATALGEANLQRADRFNLVFYEGSRDDLICGAYASAGGHGVHFLRRVDAADPDRLLPCTNSIFAAANGEFRQRTESGTHASTMVHEIFHGLGVVPTCATDHDPAPGHHAHLATISSDLMAFDGTGHTVYTLDAGRTQYYGHGRSGCLDLANSAIWEDSAPGADRIPGRPAGEP
jgi:hypothetical protein